MPGRSGGETKRMADLLAESGASRNVMKACWLSGMVMASRLTARSKIVNQARDQIKICSAPPRDVSEQSTNTLSR